MKPIYIPKGRAKEYGDYALNIYTGCPHRCFYCFAPNVLRKDRETFHSDVKPRKDIVNEIARQIAREGITGKLIHMCFSCDPYPKGYDTAATREIIKLLKDSGNHVQILTKGDGSRDFDLLGEGDLYGITITGAKHDEQEPQSLNDSERLKIMYSAPCSKWISFEPVIDAEYVLQMLEIVENDIRVKIGKLNYWPSDIDWKVFGLKAEEICKERNLKYYIKSNLKEEMERR